MGMDVLEVNTPGELVLWLHLVQSEISMEQDGAEIILDYMAEKTLHIRKLFFENDGIVFKKVCERSKASEKDELEMCEACK